MDEVELLRRLNQIAEVEAPPGATDRALDRVRTALATAPVFPNRRLQMIARYSALAAAAAAALLLGLWLFAPGGSANRAFGDVQDKVKQTKSVTMTFTARNGEAKPVTGKAWALADGRMRMEDPDGSYNVIDPKAEISLAVNPKKKEALLIRGFHNRMPTDIYALIRNIRKDEVRKLPAENVDGRQAEVFVAMVKFPDLEQEVKVWVDAKTQLPFRLEIVEQPPRVKVKQEMRIDLEFDKPLDDKLFSTKPPEGFALRAEGVDSKPPPAEIDPKLVSPLVTPGEGIGPVKFGMTKKDVIDKLGEPDKIDQRGMALDYLSRGYGILVSPQRGVMMIQCFTQATFVVKVKDFAGKTKEGIAMGASAAEIEKIYGKPDKLETEEQTTRLGYRKKLGLEFTLFNDKLVQFALLRVKE